MREERLGKVFLQVDLLIGEKKTLSRKNTPHQRQRLRNEAPRKADVNAGILMCVKSAPGEKKAVDRIFTLTLVNFGLDL